MADGGAVAAGRTIGYLGATNPTIESQRVAAFVLRLRELGWIENQTVAIEYRWAEGQNDRLPALAADLVRHPENSDLG